MAGALKLVSLNIERSKHLDLVLPFLKSQNADVVCLQELMEYDISAFEEIVGPCFFTPATRHPAEGRGALMGTGICTRLPVIHKGTRYYWGSAESLTDFDITNAIRKHETESHAVAFCDIERGEQVFRVATTHFTWTPDGRPDDFQRQDMRKLCDILERLGVFVLCGDFNAPRGGEIFSMLAVKYEDNVPPEYKTSIDVNLHRAGKIASEKMDKKMVDGLFSTPEYTVSNVELLSGVSDHMAIIATIARN
jgi:hypothetical protein